MAHEGTNACPRALGGSGRGPAQSANPRSLSLGVDHEQRPRPRQGIWYAEGQALTRPASGHDENMPIIAHPGGEIFAMIRMNASDKEASPLHRISL